MLLPQIAHDLRISDLVGSYRGARNYTSSSRVIYVSCVLAYLCAISLSTDEIMLRYTHRLQLSCRTGCVRVCMNTCTYTCTTGFLVLHGCGFKCLVLGLWKYMYMCTHEFLDFGDIWWYRFCRLLRTLVSFHGNQLWINACGYNFAQSHFLFYKPFIFLVIGVWGSGATPSTPYKNVLLVDRYTHNVS